MKKTKRRLSLLAVAVFASALANPVVAGYLSADELKSIITNKTWTGHHAFKDRRGSRYFDESGKSSGTTGTGTWRVSDEGMLCVSDDGNSNERCRFVKKDGEKYKRYLVPKNRMAGHKHVWTTTRIEDGNTQNFKLAE